MKKSTTPKALKEGKIMTTLMLSRGVKARLDQLALQTHRTLSGYTELALLAQFARDET
jgi:predicted transcriptional regulator